MTANQFYQKNIHLCMYFSRSRYVYSIKKQSCFEASNLIAPSRRKTKVDSELSAISRFAVHFELVFLWLMWPQTNLLIHVEKRDFHLKTIIDQVFS